MVYGERAPHLEQLLLDNFGEGARVPILELMNNENEELDNNIVTLKDEDGNDINFEFLDMIEFEGENYVILLPAEETDDEESDEVVILKEEKDAEGVGEDEESYVSVDDEEVLNKVFDIFKDKFKDEFNFVEE